MGLLRKNLEEAHLLSSKIEASLKQALGNVDATTHIEPSEKEVQAQGEDPDCPGSFGIPEHRYGS